MDAKTLLVIIIICASLYFMVKFQSVQTSNGNLKHENETLKLIVPMFSRDPSPNHTPKPPPPRPIQEPRVTFEDEEEEKGFPPPGVDRPLTRQFEASDYSTEDVDPHVPLFADDNDRPPMIGLDQNVDPRIPRLRDANTRFAASPPIPASGPPHRRGVGGGHANIIPAKLSDARGTEHGIQASLGDRGGSLLDVIQTPISGLGQTAPEMASGVVTDRTYA